MNEYEVEVLVRVKVVAEYEMAVKQILSEAPFYMDLNYKNRSIKTMKKQSVENIIEIK